MNKLTLLGLALGALFFIPTGAFAHDDKHHHHHHHDWSRDYRDYRDDRYYRNNDRDYWDNQRQIIQDRIDNGYNPDGSPRYQYYPRYYYRR